MVLGTENHENIGQLGFLSIWMSANDSHRIIDFKKMLLSCQENPSSPTVAEMTA